MNRRKQLWYCVIALLGILGIVVGRTVFVAVSEPPVAHIYLDRATTPALFQMIDILDRPRKEPKFVAWQRYYHPVSNRILSYLTLHKVSSKNKSQGVDFSTQMAKELTVFYHAYPHHKFIIHANIHHMWMFDMVRKIIPKAKIKQVYLYEDSIGYYLWKGWRQLNNRYAELYPVTFRFSYRDEILKKYPQVKKHKTEESDLFELAKDLTDSQKTILYYLTGLNNLMANSFFDKGPYAVFLDDPKLNVKKIAPYFDELFQKRPELKDVRWLYKNHPRSAFKRKTFDALKKYVKEEPFAVPQQVPFELLLACGFHPNYILGYSSSAFFSFKKDVILGYIPRNRDPYLPFLKQFDIVSEEKVLEDILKQDTEEKEAK